MTSFVQKNLWQDTCPDRASFNALSQSVDCDVVVIGGGFTGVSAALHLAKKGTKVILLEAETIGYGASGRNVGYVNAGLWLMPNDIVKRIGREEGSKLIKFLSDAPGTVFDLINQYDIACEAHHNGTLHCADTPGGLEELKERQKQWAEFGIEIDLLNAEKTALLTGTKEYLGALHDMRAGTIQPLCYVNGLAAAAEKEGVSVFENTSVTQAEQDGDGWLIKTANGSVKASKVISATGAYALNQPQWGAPDTSSLYYFQFATEPMTEEQRAQVLPQHHSTWDTKSVLTSFRLNEEGRMIVGSVGKLDHILSCAHKTWARRKLTKIYPILKDLEFSHEWYGRIAMTSNNIPRLAEPKPNWLTVWGYNGRGIAPGTAFGKALAQIALTGDKTHSPISFGDCKQDAFIGVQSFGVEVGASAYHMLPNS